MNQTERLSFPMFAHFCFHPLEWDFLDENLSLDFLDDQDQLCLREEMR